MKTTDHKTPETSEKTIVISRIFTCSLEKVWKAWTEPENIKKWWGPKHYTCPHFSIDFKVGGKYLACMKDKDHKEMWSTGIYKEIEDGRKIVFTDHFSDSKGNIISASEVGLPGNWPKELIITLEFDENYGKTDFTLIHEGIPAEMYDDCVKGWQETFDKLEGFLKVNETN